MLIDKINENVKEFNISFRIESAVYDLKQQTLKLILEYDNNCMLSKEIKQTVLQTVSNEISSRVNLDIKYRKNFYDTEIISNFLLDIVKREFPIISIKKSNVKYEEKDSKDIINLIIDSSYKDFVINNGFVEFLKSELDRCFKSDFTIYLELKEGILKVKNKESETNYYVRDTKTGEVEVESIEPFIGEFIDAPIFPIATYVSPEEGIVISGKVQNLKENKTKEKTDENGKTKPEKEYYTFEIADFSGVMRVVYFPTKASLQKFKKIEDGSEIVVFGNLEDDKFSAGLTFRPRVINLCVLPKNFFKQVYSKPVPKSYSKVFPEPYKQTEQSNLFVEIEDIKNEDLLNNTYVVFDLETTGTNYTSDKIIEIGAVKIVKGKLTETFGCLVNPECHIPEDATKVNGITDEDVKDAYTLDKVMPDFFKFCDGSIMVSYVIGFDFNFIDFHAKKLGYTFTNSTDDAFVMAKSKLKGLKNYKLITVAKHLGVNLDNAHRAVHDAVATGEVMVKLMENF